VLEGYFSHIELKGILVFCEQGQNSLLGASVIFFFTILSWKG